MPTNLLWETCVELISSTKCFYQLAADMGGAGYIFTGEHDADVMHNSATINLNVLNCSLRSARSSSRCCSFRSGVRRPIPNSWSC